MKLPGVPADTEQAITHLIKLTFGHNLIPIVLVILCGCVFLWAMHQPTRAKLGLFLGLLFLLGHFEYVKHVMEPLREQTVVTTATEIPRYRFIWLTERAVTKVVPTMLLFIGVLSTASSLYFLISQRMRNYTHKPHA